MIIDLHTHTQAGSDDSFLDIPEMVERARRCGIDAICLTDHDWFWRKETIDRYRRELGFPILRGCEMNTEDGHFLVFGLERFVFGMHRTAFLKQAVEEAGGAIIMAHPFRRNIFYGESVEAAVERYCQHPVFRIIDTVETLNGRASPPQTRFSCLLAEKLGLRGTGGSDAHQISDIGTTATRFEREITSEAELTRELRAGRFQAVDLRAGC